MKLTKSKLRKLVVEELSQQTKKAELTKEGFFDTIKSAFGGKKEEPKEEPIKNDKEFQEHVIRRSQEYKDSIESYMKDSLRNMIDKGGLTEEGMANFGIVPERIDGGFKLRVSDSFGEEIAAKGKIGKSYNREELKGNPPATPLIDKITFYQQKGKEFNDSDATRKAQSLLNDLNGYTSKLFAAVKEFYTKSANSPMRQREGQIETLPEEKWKEISNISLNNIQNLHIAARAPLVYIMVDEENIKKRLRPSESRLAQHNGTIIAERWQRLAGLIK